MPVTAGERTVVVVVEVEDVVVEVVVVTAADAPPDLPDDATCQRFDLLHTYRTPFTVRDWPTRAHLPVSDDGNTDPATASAAAAATGDFSITGGASGTGTPGRTDPTAAATVIAASHNTHISFGNIYAVRTQ